jgi:hypothetical protein
VAGAVAGGESFGSTPPVGVGVELGTQVRQVPAGPLHLLMQFRVHGRVRERLLDTGETRADRPLVLGRHGAVGRRGQPCLAQELGVVVAAAGVVLDQVLGGGDLVSQRWFAALESIHPPPGIAYGAQQPWQLFMGALVRARRGDHWYEQPAGLRRNIDHLLRGVTVPLAGALLAVKIGKPAYSDLHLGFGVMVPTPGGANLLGELVARVVGRSVHNRDNAASMSRALVP